MEEVGAYPSDSAEAKTERREKKLLMGNEAIAYGALESGVVFATGYPGTPSTEVIETIARLKPEVFAEWAPNEKVALEEAAGVAYTGLRALVTMKCVGLFRLRGVWPGIIRDENYKTSLYTGVSQTH